jgi:SAM-dependent methyltransferase
MNKSHLTYLASPQWAEELRRELLPWIATVGDLGDDVLEIGPGPGRSTDLLRERVARLTAVEMDQALADALAVRLAGTNVEVRRGDGADTGLPDGRFSAVTAFSVLHHVPAAEHQDRIFAEVHRVLRPGGIFAGTDALDIEPTRQAHLDDVWTPIDLASFPRRLLELGFGETSIDQAGRHFRFATRKPATSAT